MSRKFSQRMMDVLLRFTASALLHLKAVLAIPLFGAWMKRHVARRGVGVFAELADASIGIFPKHVFLARLQSLADLKSIVVGQRCASVERPTAVVDAGIILLQAFE